MRKIREQENRNPNQLYQLKMQNQNYKIILVANLRFSGFSGISLFHIGCVIVVYHLFKTTTFIQNCIYMNFRIKLTPFFINFSRQEHQIGIGIGIVQLLRFSGFIIYPLSFFLYSPFKGSDQPCMVVELSMQHCGQIL